MNATSLAEILNLPPEQRLRLVELLWESLAESPASVPLGDAHKAAIESELAAHRAAPEDVLTLDELLDVVRRS